MATVDNPSRTSDREKLRQDIQARSNNENMRSAPKLGPLRHRFSQLESRAPLLVEDINRLHTKLTHEMATTQMTAIARQIAAVDLRETLELIGRVIHDFLAVITKPGLKWSKVMAADVDECLTDLGDFFAATKDTTTELDKMTADPDPVVMQRFYRQYNITQQISQLKDLNTGLEEITGELIKITTYLQYEDKEAAPDVKEPPTLLTDTDEDVESEEEVVKEVEKEGEKRGEEGEEVTAIKEKDVVERLRALSVGKVVEGVKRELSVKNLLGRKKKVEHTRLV